MANRKQVEKVRVDGVLWGNEKGVGGTPSTLWMILTENVFKKVGNLSSIIVDYNPGPNANYNHCTSFGFTSFLQNT